MALIILAHPKFKTSLANKTIMEEVRKSKLQIETRDIHDLYPDYKIDVKAEQDALLRHHTIVFQYPIYWYNMPAILKLWFDSVFEYQFAYGSKGDKLKGKNFLPSFTVGAPESEYTTLGDHHFRIHEFCKSLEQTAYYAQMKYVDPVYFHGTSLVAGYTINDVKNKAKDQAKRLLRRLTELDNFATLHEVP
ncbi:Putative NADPH-quinone reductase (modulator of drug activity B) [Pedobacter westerhofensis]|uniref:NADPH-quinone reductase (Modulator of drug activity B) n=1 Tax=Pedobacter westerhofensis TaxID=425512 RepID=A0A521FLN1_9SPHI|nr:NAD(P)H-dependent oxidoreductase [Pedobacter westerhofensis]SMO96984.1 Putative NADPH-quinone reductase (modulator of drug activity B) [Pedobacter westerhofensis]